MPPDTTTPQSTHESPSRTEFDQLKTLIEDTNAIAVENRHVLHQMRFWGRIAFWFKVLVWGIVLVGVPLLVSTFLPFLNVVFHGALGTFGTSASSTSLFGYPSPTEFQHALGR